MSTQSEQSAPRATSEFVRGVDFVGIPTHDVPAAAAFYGDVLGLPRSVYMPERNFCEFETGNLTLSIYDPEKMGMHARAHPQPGGAARRRRGGRAQTAREPRRAVPRRCARHRRVPHGVLLRSGRERADAPPPVRAAADRRVAEVGPAGCLLTPASHARRPSPRKEQSGGPDPPDHDRRAAQIGGAGIPEGVRQRRHHVDRREHPRTVRSRRAGRLPEVGHRQRPGGDRADVRRRRARRSSRSATTTRTSTGSSRAATWSCARGPATASTRTDRGAPACPSGARAAGATCSRSATGRSTAASSTSTPTTPARTPRATRGWPTSATAPTGAVPA